MLDRELMGKKGLAKKELVPVLNPPPVFLTSWKKTCWVWRPLRSMGLHSIPFKGYSITPDRHLIDVEGIRIDEKRIFIDVDRSLFNFNQIQLKFERFYIDVKRIEIGVEWRISDAERRFCDVDRRFCDAYRRLYDVERKFCDVDRKLCDVERRFCDAERRFCDVERKISAVKVLDFDIHQKITCTHRWLFDKYESPMEFQEKFFALNREYSDLPL